jgi:hypothetical protein
LRRRTGYVTLRSVERGWKATGLLKPLWSSYGEGDETARRDKLAAAAGTTGTVLSSINTGKRNLGWDLARRLAVELGITPVELGAPAQEDDEKGLRLVARLQALEARAARQERAAERFAGAVTVRLGVLEAALGIATRPSDQRETDAEEDPL